MRNLLILLFIVVSSQSFSQEENVIKKDLTNGTISEQFDYINEESNNYLTYKVVDKGQLAKIKKNVIDSIAGFETTISNLKNQVATKTSEIISLQNNIDTANKSIITSNSEKDSINFFGSAISKNNYKTIMWGIVAILALALLFFIFRSMRNASTKKESTSSLSLLQEEYDLHVKRSLEKEQSLMRDLQDEKNKHF